MKRHFAVVPVLILALLLASGMTACAAQDDADHTTSTDKTASAATDAWHKAGEAASSAGEAAMSAGDVALDATVNAGHTALDATRHALDSADKAVSGALGTDKPASDNAESSGSADD